MDNDYIELDIDISHTIPTLDSLTADEVQTFVELMHADVERRRRQLNTTWTFDAPESEAISNTNDLINHMAAAIRNRIDNEIMTDIFGHSNWPPEEYDKRLVIEEKTKLDLRLNDDLFKME